MFRLGESPITVNTMKCSQSLSSFDRFIIAIKCEALVTRSGRNYENS